MAKKVTKKRGRPRKYAGERTNWTIRLEEKYAEQIRQMAQESDRSISDVCSQQIVNAFRLHMIVDALQKKLSDAEDRSADLMKRMELMMRAKTPKRMFGRPIREKKR